MKAKTGFYLIVTLIISSFFLFEHFQNKREYLHDNIYKQLNKVELLDSTYQSFIDYSFNKAKHFLGLNFEISINAEYDSSKLNIYTINYYRLRQNPKIKKVISSKLNSLLSSSENNILAIPKNLMIIDSEFLGFIMKHAADCFTINANVVSTYNEEYYSKEIANRIRFSELNGKRFSGIGGYSLLKEGNYIEKEYKSHAYKLMPRTYFSYIFPLIAHELAHIKYHQEDLAYGFIDGSLILENFDKLYQMELEADSVSSIIVNSYIEALFNGEVEDDSPMGFNDISYDMVFVRDFINLLSSLVIHDIFYDFRGFAPENLLINVEQKNNFEEMKDELNFSIISPSRFERITFTYPLLTDKDIKDIKSKITNQSLATHKHMYDRTIEFTNSIIGLKDSKFSIYGSTSDFISLIQDKPNNIKEYYQNLIKGKGLMISTQSFKDEFSEDFFFEKASESQIENGWIGYLKNNCGGYIELIESNKNIFSLKLVIPILATNCQKENLILLDKINSFFMSVNEFEKHKEYLKKRFDLLSSSENMDFITAIIEENEVKLRMQKLNNSKYFMIDVFSQEFNYDNLDINNYYRLKYNN